MYSITARLMALFIVGAFVFSVASAAIAAKTPQPVKKKQVQQVKQVTKPTPKKAVNNAKQPATPASPSAQAGAETGKGIVKCSGSCPKNYRCKPLRFETEFPIVRDYGNVCVRIEMLFRTIPSDRNCSKMGAKWHTPCPGKTDVCVPHNLREFGTSPQARGTCVLGK